LSADTAVRGLYGASLSVREPKRTIEFLTDILGWEVVNEAKRRTRLAVNGDLPGHRVDVLSARDTPAAINGLGTVHHVAVAVSDENEHLKLRQELVRLGVHVTPVLDRQYFRSIYFREPGGVLCEAATIPPGFTVDEHISRLGYELKLPPWEEPYRSTIEKGLARVNY
jgi:glyoxalase family protein